MECCDFTGDTDFFYFVERGCDKDFGGVEDIPKPRGDDSATGLYNFYHEENERLLFDHQLKKVRPLLDDLNTPVEEEERDISSCRQVETSLSQEFPPCYPKIEPPDPFMFLKSRHGTGRTTTIRKGGSGSDLYLNNNPNATCSHDEPSVNKRFLVSFDKNNSASDRTDQCYAAERDRCFQFWEFVNSNPELLEIIKEGKFVHSVNPNAIHCDFPEDETATIMKEIKPKKKVTPSKYTPEMEALKEHREMIRKDILNRRERLHQQAMQLRKKSGQMSLSLLGRLPPPKQLSGPPSLTTICGHYADCPNRNVNEVLAEMDQFDKISNNPVRSSCESRQRRGSLCEEENNFIQFNEFDYGEYYGEDESEETKEPQGDKNSSEDPQQPNLNMEEEGSSETQSSPTTVPSLR